MSLSKLARVPLLHFRSPSSFCLLEYCHRANMFCLVLLSSWCRILLADLGGLAIPLTIFNGLDVTKNVNRSRLLQVWANSSRSKSSPIGVCIGEYYNYPKIYSHLPPKEREGNHASSIPGYTVSPQKLEYPTLLPQNGGSCRGVQYPLTRYRGMQTDQSHSTSSIVCLTPTALVGASNVSVLSSTVAFSYQCIYPMRTNNMSPCSNFTPWAFAHSSRSDTVTKCCWFGAYLIPCDCAWEK